MPQYHTLTQTFNAGGGEINMNIVKSASKLSNAFITLYREKKTGKRYDIIDLTIIFISDGITSTIQ